MEAQPHISATVERLRKLIDNHQRYGATGPDQAEARRLRDIIRHGIDPAPDVALGMAPTHKITGRSRKIIAMIGSPAPVLATAPIDAFSEAPEDEQRLHRICQALANALDRLEQGQDAGGDVARLTDELGAWPGELTIEAPAADGGDARDRLYYTARDYHQMTGGRIYSDLLQKQYTRGKLPNSHQGPGKQSKRTIRQYMVGDVVKANPQEKLTIYEAITRRVKTDSGDRKGRERTGRDISPHTS